MATTFLFFFLRFVSNEKILNVDKANSTLFEFNFESFFYCNWYVASLNDFKYSVAYFTIVE